MTADEALGYLREWGKWGVCLVNDDAGHWAISDSGFQSVEEKIDQQVCWIDKHRWADTIEGAVAIYAAEQKAK